MKQGVPTDWKRDINAKFTAVELDAATNVLEFAIAAFKIMEETSLRNKDMESVRQLKSYINFASLFAEKLYEILETGDLDNKTFH
jgi:hypothetical protein